MPEAGLPPWRCPLCPCQRPEDRPAFDGRAVRPLARLEIKASKPAIDALLGQLRFKSEPVQN